MRDVARSTYFDVQGNYTKKQMIVITFDEALTGTKLQLF